MLHGLPPTPPTSTLTRTDGGGAVRVDLVFDGVSAQLVKEEEAVTLTKTDFLRIMQWHLQQYVSRGPAVIVVVLLVVSCECDLDGAGGGSC